MCVHACVVRVRVCMCVRVCVCVCKHGCVSTNSSNQSSEINIQTHRTYLLLPRHTVGGLILAGYKFPFWNGLCLEAFHLQILPPS